jgi:phosphatidate cytidylyltransferase
MTQPRSAAAASGRRSDLGVRAVAGVGMIAVALAALWAGGIAFWLLASAAAMAMIGEWAGLARVARWKVTLAIVLLAIVLIGARWLISDPVRGDAFPGRLLLMMFGLGGAGAVTLALLSLSPRLGAGLLYAGLPAMSLVYLRDEPHGLWLALWTLAVVWATDIGAYFAGRTIGGPKLAPVISPNKTWSGLIGGVLAALGVGAAIAAGAGLSPQLLFLGAAMAILAQLGDLYESWLKRRAGVKDSGRLLPGHGGVLDRLDGLVPVAVAVALLRMLGWL